MSPRPRSPRADKGRKEATMLALSALVIIVCALVAQLPPPSDANSDGPPNINIENENCFCHTNTVTGKEADDDVDIYIDPSSPDKMVTGGTTVITIGINYARANNDTMYGFAIDLDSADGKGLEGAELDAAMAIPSENKTHLAHMEPMKEHIVNVTVTAPDKPQKLEFTVLGLVADGDGTEKGDHWNFKTKVLDIYKAREVDINATVSNVGDLEARDINVSFLVDGELIGIEHIDTIPAGSNENVSLKWDATFYEPGEYKVEILVDANGTTLELNEGNNRMVKTVVLEPLVKTEGKKEYDWQTILLGLIGAIIVIGVIWALYRRFT